MTTPFLSRALDARLEQPLRRGAAFTLRASLVFLLLLYGAFKFFDFEAQAIRPVVESSPLFAWLYPVLGVRGTSALFGVIEVPVAILIAGYRWWPRAAGYASLAAAGMFLTTLSFLVTMPAGIRGDWSGFLMKDAVLLGAALFTAAESFERARQS